MATGVRKFPLLNQIDEQLNSDSVEWNQNAFQTLLTSNLPTITICYYAIDVGLRRLENSLYENYWDVTADALNDLSQYLLNIPVTNDLDAYLYEATCQLLMFASIALLKLHRIRHQSANEAKMACTTMCILLLEQSKSYEPLTIHSEYSSCIRSMGCRYRKRIFIIGHWLPTLSKAQFHDIQTNHERYMAIMFEHLFASVSIRDKFNKFIDQSLLNTNPSGNDLSENDALSHGFVFVRRFPKFNEKTIENYHYLMHIDLVNTLKELNKNPSRTLIHCIWTLSCMIEADRVSLGVFNNHFIREHFSSAPIDFEQKPITMNSINEQDLVLFVILCAQQNVHTSEGDSILNPYLLYSSSHLCTQSQTNWWLTSTDQIPSTDFLDHLATIRLDDERTHHYPPNVILLRTAKILFQAAETNYEQYAHRAASSYEQYAIQYLQTAKAQRINQKANSSLNRHHQEPFFRYATDKLLATTNEENQQLTEQCEKLARQCDELKLLPRTSSPTKEDDKNLNMSATFSPVDFDETFPVNLNEPLFITPPSNKSRDIDVQTIESLVYPPIIETPPRQETVEIPTPTSPPFVDMIFSHMTGVNQWIHRFYASSEGIQNDINTIRDRLEQLNRATSQMIYTNVGMFQSNPSETSGQFYPSQS